MRVRRSRFDSINYVDMVEVNVINEQVEELPLDESTIVGKQELDRRFRIGGPATVCFICRTNTGSL
jgi:hypothetical protein